jgi:hypothetical protein
VAHYSDAPAQISRITPGWMIMRLSERLLRSAEPKAR